MQRCQSVTGENGGVEILEEDDCQGKIMAIELECGDRDNGVNGVVEGQKAHLNWNRILIATTLHIVGHAFDSKVIPAINYKFKHANVVIGN